VRYSIHRARTHPTPVDDCWPCQLLTIGYDGGHTTQVTVVDERGSRVREHRSGREDVIVCPPSVHVQLQRKEPA
jgi:hypothetical protein